MSKIAIVIPSYTNSTGLHACLRSLVEYTDLQNVSVIVVANGAPDESRDVDRQYPNTQLTWLPEACGYTKATNIGIKTAMAQDADFIVLMNDDFECTDQVKNTWLNMLLAPMLEDGAVGVTGPVRNFCHAANRSFLIFFCVMVRRTLFDEVGILDEVFSPGSGEDTDLCCRAEDHGWKIRQVPTEEPTKLVNKGCEDLPEWKRIKMHTSTFPGFHDGNATFSLIPEIYEPAMQKNHAILKERYSPNVSSPNTCPRCNGPAENGICIGSEGKLNCDGLYLWRAHMIDGWFNIDEGEWLARQVKSLPPSSKVLEVGSWHGRSSRFIADNLSEGSQVVCVDSWNGSSGEPDAHLSAAQREGDHAHSWWWCNAHTHIMAGRVVPMREHSVNAAETLAHLIQKGEMEKFSLVFIDGDHSAEGIQRDVEAWLPLLKEGGLLCGHDYYKENEGPWWVHVREYIEEKFPNVEKSATSIWHVRPHVGVLQVKEATQAEPERGRTFDAFLFHNELDVLEIRLATLYDHVDYFVLVEAGETHSGNPKPLNFELNKERFTPYLNKIRHVVIDKFPDFQGSVYDQAWARERYQRDACTLALGDAQPNDVVIIGDADEIASPEAIDAYRLSDGLVRLKQRMFYYYLNCENKEGWDWQKIAPYSLVKERTPCGIRYPPAGDVPLVEGGGWHFSFLGDSEHIRQKIRDYSHQEYNTPEILDDVEAAIREGRDVFGRGLRYEFVDLSSGLFPEYVHQHWSELAHAGFWRVAPTMKAVFGVAVNTAVPDLSSRHWTVTASVSTKDRYTTTLPLTLSAIFNQSRLPDKFILYDDSDERIPAEQLCQRQPFEGLFKLATDKGIKWEIQSTPRLGQVANHQHCLNTADTMFIWRVDDDEVPEPDCLETLLNTIRDYERGGSMGKIGAVGGLVHHPGAVSELPQGVDGSLNDIAAGLSLQWFNWNGGVRETQHLYSTFLYQVDAARKAGGYPLGLSKVGHREESIFTHSLHRAGYKVLTTPWTKTYHLRDSSGGIRSNPDPAQWEHDEQEWQRLLKMWNVVTLETKLIVADFGLGDTLILRGVWPDLVRKFPERKWTLSLCYPEVFRDVPDMTIISIADAKLLVGDRYGDYSLYKWCWDNNWTGSIVDAMKEFYGR